MANANDGNIGNELPQVGGDNNRQRMSMFSSVRLASVMDKLRQRELMRKKENEGPETFLDFVIDKIDVALKNSIPMQQIHILPRFYYYSFGFLVNAVFGVAFALFFYYNYTAITTTPFISIEKTSGCVEVAKPLSGVFKATIDGYWEGDSQYSSNKALYEFQFNDLSLTPVTYRRFMQNIYNNVIIPSGEASEEYNLPFNLLYLMSYKKIFTVDGNEQQFSFLGDPSMVFHHLTYSAGVAGGYSNPSTYYSLGSISYCQPLPSIYYDFATAELVLTYDPQIFRDQCGNITSLNYLGYGYYNHYQSDFKLYLPFKTFLTSAAINLNMTEYNNLQTTYEPSNNQFTYRNVTYAIEFKYDSKYPGMKKLVCIRNIGGSDPTATVAIDAYCFVRLDYRLAIPLFTHYFGYEDCNKFAYYNRDEYDNFYLITGFLYMESDNFHQNYDGSIAYHSLNDTIDLLSTYDMKTLHTSLAGAAVCTAYPSLSCTYNWTVCDNKCTIISVGNEWDYHDFAVTQDFYQLKNGSCNNVVYNASGFERLIETLPMQLTEKYYKCSSKGSAALLNSFGVAAGNTTGFTPLFILMLLPVLYYSLKSLDLLPEKDTYSQDEKSAAIGELAEYILSYRDGVDTGFDETSIVNNLSKELILGAIRGTTTTRSSSIGEVNATGSGLDVESNNGLKNVMKRHRHSIFAHKHGTITSNNFKLNSVLPEPS